MAYNGWLVKVGNYTIPKRYLRAESYSPYVNMQDVDPWTDANGYVHRNAVDLKAMKIEFETPAMLSNIEFGEFMRNIRANYVGGYEKERRVIITAYIPEIDDYVTQTGYIADFQPTMYSANDKEIRYNAIKFSFIGGVADG